MNKARFKIVGLGEVLFDVLPTGEKMLGGAPANFAYVSTQLGNCGIVASRVGDDSDGKIILRDLKDRGVDVSHVQVDSERQTGIVNVVVENGQPDYEIVENSAWDFMDFEDDWRDLARSCDAVCFGTLAQRNPDSGKAIRAFLASTDSECLRIFDVNLRRHYFSEEIIRNSLNAANVLKLNHDELPKIAEICDLKVLDCLDLLKALREKFNLQIVCLTRGANGSVIVSKDEISGHEGIETTVENTIGAGDAFTAALVEGLLENRGLDVINKKANRVGAFVASRKGAMPDFSEFDFTKFSEK